MSDFTCARGLGCPIACELCEVYQRAQSGMYTSQLDIFFGPRTAATAPPAAPQTVAAAHDYIVANYEALRASAEERKQRYRGVPAWAKRRN